MVKKKKEDRYLRDLFGDGLDNFELTPSVKLRSKVMNRVRTREFFSANPSKFNIWYAALIGVAALTTTIILTIDKRPAETEVTVPAVVVDTLQIVAAPGADTVAVLPAKQVETVALKTTAPPPTPPPQVQEIKGAVPTDKVATVTPLVEITTEKIEDPLPANEGVSGEKPVVRSASEPLFTASVYKGCAPLGVKFTVGGVEGDSYRWSFGDGGFSSEKDPQWLFDEEGEYNVTLKVFVGDGVVADCSAVITVYPKPVARFEFSPENPVLPDDAVTFLNYSTGALGYRWTFGDGNSAETFEPTHKYARYGHYNVSLVAISEYGCEDSVYVADAFTASAYYIEFPNAFIPNPEGESGGYYTDSREEADKVFHPVAYGVAGYQLKIFNRQGIQLFESNDLTIGWDGYYKSKLCEAGVYIWKVRGTYLNGEPFTEMGDVTLIKIAQ